MLNMVKVTANAWILWRAEVPRVENMFICFVHQRYIVSDRCHSTLLNPLEKRHSTFNIENQYHRPAMSAPRLCYSRMFYTPDLSLYFI